MLGTVKTGEDNESISTVCHAAGENAFAVGNNTTASGDFSIAGGTESVTNHKNSIAVGDHANTSADNQVVFGAYNKENTELFNKILYLENYAHENKWNSYITDINNKYNLKIG